MKKYDLINNLVRYLKKNLPIIPFLFSFIISIWGYYSLNKKTLNPEDDLPIETLSEAKITAFKDWINRIQSMDLDELKVANSVTNISKEININYFWKIPNMNIEVGIDSLEFSSLLNEVEENAQLMEMFDFEYDLDKFDSLRTLTYSIVRSDVLRFVAANKINYTDVGLDSDFDISIDESDEEIIKQYNKGVVGFKYENQYEFRIENVLILIASGVIFSFLLFQIPKIGSAKTSNIKVQKRKELESKELPNILFYDLQVSEEKADELYNRSSIMLVSGIIMSIVGIIVFSLSLPEIKSYEQLNLNGYLIRSVRPSLMLIFIESIAFFLLRQYRVLIEDFKYFHKLFLQRINYAQCYHLVNDSGIKEGIKITLIDSLLNERLDGKLRSGETTENLEAIKLTDSQDPTVMLEKIANIVLQSNKK